MLQLTRTNADNTDFLQLVELLDEDLRIRDGEDHAFYAVLNKTNTIRHAIVAYENEIPVGCGAIREYAEGIVEIKRMYVLPEKRGKGIASAILKELEQWAAELGHEKCILETGKNQPEAIAMYKKNNYTVIPNFGKYQGVENSVCFEKQLIANSH
jgi:putative acetyltransferase